MSTISSEERNRAALQKAVARVATEDATAKAADDATTGVDSAKIGIEKLLRLREGALTSAEARALEESLAARPDESVLLTEIDSFLRPTAPDAPADVAARRAWLATRDALFGRDSGDSGDSANEPGAVAPGAMRRPALVAWALAAGFGLIALGLGLWSARLGRQVERLEARVASGGPVTAGTDDLAPVVGTRVQELYEAPSTLRQIGGEPSSRGETSQLTAPSGSESLTVFLHTAEGFDSGDYTVEWLASRGSREEVLWRATGLRSSREGNLVLVFPSGALQPGSAVLEVFRAGEEQGDPLARFPLEVVVAD